MTSLPPGIDLSTIPLAPPPPGMTSNFVNPESLANTVMGTGIFTLVLTVFVVIVRLFSNYHAPRGLSWEDGSCVIATILLLIYVVIVLEVRDFARHSYDLPVIWITSSYLKKIFAQNITAGPMFFFAKASLLMLYYRLFKTQKFTRYAIIFGITFSFVFYFSFMIAVAIQCVPKAGFPWNLTVAEKCSQLAVFGFIFGIINLALDIFLLILPIPVILALQLSVKKKIGVLAVFMVGSFALVASITALVYRIKNWQGTDIEWNAPPAYICAMIETGVTIMCSSTSSLVAFWKSHMATNVAILNSRLCSLYSELATRSKFVSRSSSNTQIFPPESDQSKSYRSFDNLNYVELDERHQESTGISGIVRTEIGGGSPISEVEKGVIRKSMKVEQSFN